MCGREPVPKSALEHRQAVNKATAQFIPLLLVGIVGYATWVVVVLVCGMKAIGFMV
jgi:palmitoyltransferase